MNSEWELDSDRKLTFFKCTKWQFEDTLDPINCPFHYFCDSLYPGDYPHIIDLLAFFFITFTYLTTLIVVLRKVISNRRREDSENDNYDDDDDDDKTIRYLLPSSPISLPLIILILAKGQRINTLFPISNFGPAILELVQFSVLIFENNIDKEASFVFLEASIISGILHASLYLDAVILPYYTGIDALVTSTFSGVCKSCICRKEPLTVGGKIVAYRGWSSTTFLVVGVLCLRIICKLCREEAKRKRVLVVKNALEGLGLLLLIRDCVYVAIMTTPVEEPILFKVFGFGSLLLLICVHVITKVCCLVSWRQSKKTSDT